MNAKYPRIVLAKLTVSSSQVAWSVILAVLAILLLLSGQYLIAALELYIITYFLHPLILPRPYLELRADALVLRSHYGRYVVHYSDISLLKVTNTPDPGHRIWSIIRGRLRPRSAPVILIVATNHWWLHWLALPPVPIPRRSNWYTRTWSADTQPFFEELARRTTGRIERDDLGAEQVAG